VEDLPKNADPNPRQSSDLGASERAAALIGRVISDRYRIAELLAMGGMGAVYRGEHLLLKKRIAIKILHPEIENLPDLVARFEREAIAGAHIQHPNVAAATDFGKLDDGSFFLVLEYVRGTTLHHVIRGGPVEPRRAVHIARQIALALGAAHAMGIVHRDVKPRNVMLIEGKGDQAKLIDFGLAKVSMERLADSLRSPTSGSSGRRALGGVSSDRGHSGEGERLTGVGVIFGTIAYLAPEAAFGMDAVDARADLYALGLILYEMLTGNHPFEASDMVELFKKQRWAAPPSFAARAPAVAASAALEAVVMRLLEKDPAARYQTTAELVAALDASLVEGATPPLEGASSPGDASAKAGGERPSPPLAAAGATTVEVKATEPRRKRKKPKVQGKGGAPTRPSPHMRLAATTLRSEPTPTRRAESLDATRAEGSRRAAPILVAAAVALAVMALVLLAGRRAAERRGAMAESSPSAVIARADSPIVDPRAERMMRTMGATTGAMMSPTSEAAPSASAPEPPEPAPSAANGSAGEQAAAPAELPASLDGIDATGLRIIVIKATRSQLYSTAEEAWHALAARDPAAFERQDVIAATRELIVDLERQGAADAMFDALEHKLSGAGLDALYDVVESKGGSRAATRAAELLRKEPTRGRASAALRIAIDLRDAPCVDMLKLLDRAVQDGDGRALVVLQTFGLACFRKSREVDQAITDLRAKLTKR
jgi:eukaryotic-like serine/threonine-protein kinase